MEGTDLKHFPSRVVKAEVAHTVLGTEEHTQLDKRSFFFFFKASRQHLFFLASYFLFHLPEALSRRLLEHSLSVG